MSLGRAGAGSEKGYLQVTISSRVTANPYVVGHLRDE